MLFVTRRSWPLFFSGDAAHVHRVHDDRHGVHYPHAARVHVHSSLDSHALRDAHRVHDDDRDHHRHVFFRRSRLAQKNIKKVQRSKNRSCS